MKKKPWIITPDKFLSKEQIQHLLNYLALFREDCIQFRDIESLKSYYVISVLLQTGVRVAEFCDLRRSDLIGDKLVVRKGKGNKARTILLTAGTSKMITEWLMYGSLLSSTVSNLKIEDAETPMFRTLKGNKYSTRAIQKRSKKIFKKLNLPKRFCCHSLRHCYCSLLIEANVGLGTIRENMGHSSLSTTQLYVHVLNNLTKVDLFTTFEKKHIHDVPSKREEFKILRRLLSGVSKNFTSKDN